MTYSRLVGYVGPRDKVRRLARRLVVLRNVDARDLLHAVEALTESIDLLIRPDDFDNNSQSGCHQAKTKMRTSITMKAI